MVDSPSTRRATALAVGALIAACPTPSPRTSPGTSLAKAPQPAGLVITAPAVGSTLTLSAASGLTLPAGFKKQLAVTETYADGSNKNVTTTVAWASSSAPTGMVNPAGIVSATAVGNTTITATLGLLTQAFPLSVQPAIVSIAIATDLSGLWVGDTESAVLVATLSDGSTADLTGLAGWTSGATNVATVSSAGAVTGVNAGASVITATLATFTAAATATVLATKPALVSIAIGTANKAPTAASMALLPPLSRALGVWGTYSETGAVQNITALGPWTWSSSNTAAATISPGGVVTAVAAGATTIAVSGPGMSATLSVTVTAAIQSLTLANLPASLAPGTYLYPEVIAALADGTSADVTSFARFTSSSRHIAAAQGGAIVAQNAGTATITATVESLTAAAMLNVKTVSLLQIVPATLSIPPGFTDNWVAAFATLSDGSVIDATASVNWSSGTPAVADFGTGTQNEANTPLVAMSPGTTTITATLGSTSATAPVTVTPAVTVSGLALSPPSATVPVAAPVRLVATATLSDNSALDVTPFVTWGTGAAVGGLTFVTDYAAGTYAAFAPAGTDTASAQLGSASATATITVSTATLLSIDVSPKSMSLSAGETVPLTVTATYSDASTANVTALAVWSSTDTAGTVAIVDETSGSPANVVALGAGTATFTAWVSLAGPFMGGAVESSATTAITVQ